MADRVTPPRKSFADLLRESVSASQTDRANALLESFRKAYPEIAKVQTEVVRPGEFRGQVHDAVFIDESCHISDAVAYGLSVSRRQAQPGYRIPATITKPLREYATAELVMELLGRGFAVHKIPEPKA